jgi:hypothetical protein
MYEEASGQLLNREKTGLFFSRNTKADIRSFISQSLGVSSTAHYEKYLGLPSLIGRSRVSTFNGIKERIWKRINGWKERFLSHAGKEILIKTVIQAILTYTMSVFRLPKRLCREINSLMRRFWWGHKDKDSKIAWMAWGGMGKHKLEGGLGYRDLRSFNNALLAKQGWRLINNPDTLVGRIFQEKYYPTGDFLSSSLGSCPSYAWRSIWEAIPLLKEGLMWRVGDGSTIKIRDDKWIPFPKPYPLQAQVQNLNPEARVCELIDFESKWWNVPLLEQIFPADMVELISNIPISPRLMKDRLVWAGNKNGHFSVCSAYFLDLEREKRNLGSSSRSSYTKDCWKLLWNLKIPRSVQLFLWRVCNDILPTKEKLWKMRLVENPLCPLCGLESESSTHAVWLCDAAKAVWSECPSRIQKSSSGNDDFLTLFGMLNGRLDLEDMELFAMVAQRIWFRRNRFVFEGVFTPPNCLIRGAKEALQDFKKAHDSSFILSHPNPPSLSHQWSKPPQGVYKLNWDAAVDRKQRLIGVGIVARDCKGKVLAARCSFHRYISNPAVAEAFGAKICAEFGLFLGLRNVVLEGDALEVVRAISREGDEDGYLGNLIGETRHLLRGFECWAVSHVRRAGNMVAHNLAKLAVLHPQNHVWFGYLPACILSLVSSEC